MKLHKSIFILFFALAMCFVFNNNTYSGGVGPSHVFTPTNTDSIRIGSPFTLSLFYVFDLRDRETFIQFTYNQNLTGDTTSAQAHIQIFDVSNNCNENNFFDVYTLNDTHVYNIRNIQTNDGNPAGVQLPENAYGIVVISYITVNGNTGPLVAFGNLRIIDNNGYEYRTNAQQVFIDNAFGNIDNLPPIYTFNFNSTAGVILSDIMGITVNLKDFGNQNPFEWDASDPLSAFNPFEINILNNNETLFSCRDITFACVNEDNPLLEELLEESGTSVASFEYGINNAIPHSKGGELLCPGNTISEGIVTLNPKPQDICCRIDDFPIFLGFVGLNNGNGRGSMDSLWYINFFAIGTG